ncbi:YdeI/OmpD-associated family protein [Dysgonomonas macrotermitis]|uniref:Bacteriocin-protection, YdeI or OmpD-Associated n=1 Tax=Dysgonomonas macrotermitis TaxID=1346286 RepID=A0A1M4WDE7_9BACT|nr:YdeI/OmpD-associated family protein [Dysgonomonas macrotermitis]SHE79244.1 Bacteriocin-protection, YdeI or OmpD-Associated [Dysgonomonas macrotermitis]
MEIEKPLVDKDYQLQKPDYKGSVTYVEIPEIPMAKAPFGMLKVKGKIDDYEFSNVHLMPLGNGNLVLPVKSAIKKKIQKEAPDTVHVTIYEDKTPLIIPEELILCMKYEDGVLEKFENYSDGQKKAFVDWINSAKTEQTKADRIAKSIIMLQKGEKFYDKLK